MLSPLTTHSRLKTDCVRLTDWLTHSLQNQNKLATRDRSWIARLASSPVASRAYRYQHHHEQRLQDRNKTPHLIIPQTHHHSWSHPPVTHYLFACSHSSHTTYTNTNQTSAVEFVVCQDRRLLEGIRDNAYFMFLEAKDSCFHKTKI